MMGKAAHVSAAWEHRVITKDSDKPTLRRCTSNKILPPTEPYILICHSSRYTLIDSFLGEVSTPHNQLPHSSTVRRGPSHNIWAFKGYFIFKPQCWSASSIRPEDGVYLLAWQEKLSGNTNQNNHLVKCKIITKYNGRQMTYFGHYSQATNENHPTLTGCWLLLISSMSETY